MSSEIIRHQTEDVLTNIKVTFDNSTVWLSIDELANLFTIGLCRIGSFELTLFFPIFT